MTPPVFLVTGGSGCIGSACIANLVNRGYQVVVGDANPTDDRLKLWLPVQKLAKVKHAPLDVRRLSQLTDAVTEHGVTHVIHLAGIQMPGCQQNPALGCEVNVVGTTNVYEAVRQSKGQVRGLAIASSVASEAVPDGVHKGWFYSVWKAANEGTAKCYASEFQIGSVALLPYIVFGPGRWDGMTSQLTKAVLAAAVGVPYKIGFTGPVVVQDAEHVGRCFVQAALAERKDARLVKIGGPATTVAQFVGTLNAVCPGAAVTYGGDELPFDADEDDGPLQEALGVQLTPPDLRTMVQGWFEWAKQLRTAGLIDLKVLDN